MSILVKWGTERLQFSLPSPDTKLGQLRQMLAEHTSLDPKSFKLIHAGAVMKDDNAPISTYGIQNRSTLALVGTNEKPPTGSTKSAAAERPTEQSTIARVQGELAAVRSNLLQPVEGFLASIHPPEGEKQPTRGDTAQEHKRLDELLLQSLLRLDAITPDGAWEDARRERKLAVREVQGLLDKLDAGWKSLPQ
ncbi:hypothetical protein EXIGLDRAFT_685811 [Exidia glandulosa HHB12029]|uniref:BAG domain-containing protein n=1 Tax=Exidia glandulosa HHB12029 TaxID=1314781 RepID=A0A165C174_EXIGL|nr:hypothetical protein EXIGLDRAFT_685811 [Exidia glandulosa HHB12029]